MFCMDIPASTDPFAAPAPFDTSCALAPGSNYRFYIKCMCVCVCVCMCVCMFGCKRMYMCIRYLSMYMCFVCVKCVFTRAYVWTSPASTDPFAAPAAASTDPFATTPAPGSTNGVCTHLVYVCVCVFVYLLVCVYAYICIYLCVCF